MHDERFFFKNSYGKEAFKKEIVRLEYVEKFLRIIYPGIELERTGFGAGDTQIYYEHPEKPDAPDLAVKKNNTIIMHIEVSGTTFKRGNDYWVRPDKLIYAQNHRNVPHWIILHYQKPFETLIFIKPDPCKDYNALKVVKKLMTLTRNMFALPTSMMKFFQNRNLFKSLNHL